MRKPTFAATFSAIASTLTMAIDDPHDVEGTFRGYEVLMKVGGVVSPTPWQSVANLSASRRYYSVEGIQPLSTHTVTVRGHLSSKRFSALADPVEFMGVDKALSAPQHVQLVALDSHRVHITWQPPLHAYGRITRYAIAWRVDNIAKPSIYLYKETNYTFTTLRPGQTISASVAATSRPDSSMNIQLHGDASPYASASTPLPVEGG
ncbi:unnamed protein product [Hydatigera taeniaeformis]|uniref:Fibronectin type-III domain-containing protein n=1 Tax=Hydatigena taeniaeformis TaxID=6205 RepID=A0A0R3XCC7_HYDTA|nr:unnamed protein product [Hydatigera taeniaeformis]